MRPARTEITICTELRTRGGVQVWGSYANIVHHTYLTRCIS